MTPVGYSLGAHSQLMSVLTAHCVQLVLEVGVIIAVGQNAF